MLHRPETVDELAAIIGGAAARGTSLGVAGSGSRPGLGPGAAAAVLDLSGMTGRIIHDPAELVLTAPAATPMQDITAALARAGQCLAFEPPCPDGLWGRGAGTLGGCVAAGLSGPRRPFAGAARDHVLGVAGVTGRAEIFAAGGKVIKNVTGFDLARLLTGSRGTLAVLTRISIKVLPLPPGQATIAIPAETVAQGVAVLSAAMAVDGGITGAAWRDGTALVRIEASAAALPALVEAAAARLPGGAVIEAGDSRALWAGMASLDGVAGTDEIVWRCPLPATAAPALAAALPAGARLQLDWGGALAWVLLPAGLVDFDMHGVQAAVAGRDGHAMRLRLPAGMKSAVPARGAIAPGVAALSARIKQLFDPAGILSPAAVPFG